MKLFAPGILRNFPKCGEYWAIYSEVP